MKLKYLVLLPALALPIAAQAQFTVYTEDFTAPTIDAGFPNFDGTGSNLQTGVWNVWLNGDGTFGSRSDAGFD
jgi:hypothetical protein